MANLFETLPVLTTNGAGADVDVSGMGARKTIKIEGGFLGLLAIEVSLDGGATFEPVAQFNDKGTVGLDFAADRMRVTRSLVPPGRGTPAPVVTVAANDNGAQFLPIPIPSTVGIGASVDVSALGSINSISLSGPVGGFNGRVLFEMSDDNVNFAEIPGLQFGDAGFKTAVFAAQFVRARREGGPTGGTPPAVNVANIGAANDSGSGGGGGGAAGLVFQPGGGGTGPVFFDAWADLMAQLTALRTAGGGDVPITLWFDDTQGGTLNIPAGVHDMENVEWRVVDRNPVGGNPTAILLADGAQVPNLSYIEGPATIVWEAASGTTPRPWVDGDQVVVRSVNFSPSAPAGNTGFFGGGNRGAVSVHAYDYSEFRGVSGPTLDFTDVDAPDTLRLFFDNTSVLRADALRGNVEIELGKAGDYEAQPNFAGSFGGFQFRAVLPFEVVNSNATPQTAEPGQLRAINSVGGAKILNLPAITEWNTGVPIVVKELATAPTSITVTPAGGDTIDGAATFVMSIGKQSITLVPDIDSFDWRLI